MISLLIVYNCQAVGLISKAKHFTSVLFFFLFGMVFCRAAGRQPRAKIEKEKNLTQNKSQTQRARAYKVTSFLSTDCELSTEACSKNVGPDSRLESRQLFCKQNTLIANDL